MIAKADPGSLALPTGEAGVDAYGWAHNETSTGVMAPVARPGGRRRRRPGPHRRHQRRRRPAGRRRADRRLLLRPAEVLRRRRRAVGGADVGRRPGAGRGDQGVRPLDPRLPGPVDRRRQLHARTRPTTPPPSPRCSCWPTRSTGCSPSAGSPAPSPAPRESSGRLYGWAEKSEYATPVRRPTRRTGRWSSARSTSPTRSTPRRSRRRCAPTASSTPSPTASSAATSCASACSRPSTPTT